MTDTVLVTGASGALGRRVTAGLRADGRRVRALVHRVPVDDADEYAAGSILDLTSMRRATHNCAAVVHLAAVTHARRASDYLRVNTEGTRVVVDAARREGARRLLFVSTRAISREGGSYSLSKLRAEEAVLASELDWTIVRLPEVYGAGGTEGVDLIMSRALAGKGIPIVGHGSQEICPLHVADAVDALVRALDSGAAIGKTYTLAGDCTTVRRLAETSRRVAGSESRIIEVPRWAVRLACELGRLLPLPVVPDQLARLTAAKPPMTDAATTELGFAPRTLELGLSEVCARQS